MGKFRGERVGRLIKGLGLSACAIVLVSAGWFVGQRESVHEVARLNGEIDAMVNDQVASRLAERSESSPGVAPRNTEAKVAVYDFGALVCNTTEQAEILMASHSLQKRIVGRICAESL